MKISIIRCFCDEHTHSGNPAAVIEHFKGSDEQRQALAAKLYANDKMPVTVFIEEHANIHAVRFFYPSSEMNLCIHGTLAAARLILDKTKQEACSFITKIGKEIYVRQEKNSLQAILKETHTNIPDIDDKKLRSLLNLDDDFALNQNFPCGVYSVGSPKLLIPLNSIEELKKLNPNFEAITQWSNETGVNGLYVYAPLNNSTHEFTARAFNPRAGCNEDAATGVAVGALACALKLPQISVSQGECIGRPCRLTAIYHHDDNISVGGIIRPFVC